MIAKLFASSVIVEDQLDIIKLQTIGYGANRLSPIIINKNQKQLLNYVHNTTNNDNIDRIDDDNRDSKSLSSYLSPLLLLDEEALYLVKYSNLVIYNKAETLIDIDTLWSLFTQKTPKFISKYKVYEYYKNCKYIIKTGMNFGADYALYRGLPSECHSEICIIVVDTTNTHNCNQDIINNPAIDLSWRHISTLTRVMPDIMKICILCYVLEDSNNIFSSIDNNEIKCDNIEERSPYLDLLFSNMYQNNYHSPDVDTLLPLSKSCYDPSNLNKSNISYINHLTLHPITVSVRRTSTLSRNDKYETITDLYQKYVRSARKQKKNNRSYNKNNKQNINNVINNNVSCGYIDKHPKIDSKITNETNLNIITEQICIENPLIHIETHSDNINKNINLEANEIEYANFITTNNINSDINTSNPILNAIDSIINNSNTHIEDHTIMKSTDVITTITTTNTETKFNISTNSDSINNNIDTNIISSSKASAHKQRYSRKANKVRRDHKVVRFKELTKSNKVFRKLMNSPTTTTTTNNNNNNNNLIDKQEQNVSKLKSYDANMSLNIVTNNNKRVREDDRDQQYQDEINKLKNNHQKDKSNISIFESCLVM